jgi:hypothetical protein
MDPVIWRINCKTDHFSESLSSVSSLKTLVTERMDSKNGVVHDFKWTVSRYFSSIFRWLLLVQIQYASLKLTGLFFRIALSLYVSHSDQRFLICVFVCLTQALTKIHHPKSKTFFFWQAF